MNDSLRLLRLLQLTDSGFPTGAFAFSHGLEGLVAADYVRGARDLEEVVSALLREGFAGIECPAMAHAWRAARAKDVAALIELDTVVGALKPVPAFRRGSERTGRRLLESAAVILTGAVLDRFRESVQDGKAAGHHSVAFGVVMEAVDVDEKTAALALGASFANGLAAAAVRLGIVGQGAAQRIVAKQQPAIIETVARGRATAIAEMGCYLPMIDIAGLRQPALAGRVFAS